jgi:twitching motility protein PilT
MEICVVNGRVAEAIADQDKTNTLTDLIKDGAYYGMQTFDQSLVQLIRDGVVTMQDGLAIASNPHDLTVELRRLGLVA